MEDRCHRGQESFGKGQVEDNCDKSRRGVDLAGKAGRRSCHPRAGCQLSRAYGQWASTVCLITLSMLWACCAGVPSDFTVSTAHRSQ